MDTRMMKFKRLIAKLPFGRLALRVWNWLTIRMYVLVWMFLNGRSRGFNEAVRHVEERNQQSLRTAIYELRAEGKIKGEVDENGERRYYPVDK